MGHEDGLQLAKAHQVQKNAEKVLSLMTQYKSKTRGEIAGLSGLGDDDVLAALRHLESHGKVFTTPVDGEKGIMWTRISGDLGQQKTAYKHNHGATC